MKSYENEIRAHALKNAIEFGKTSPDKILPKLFAHGLKKSEIKSTLPEIKDIVKEVNSLNEKEREIEFQSLKDLIPEKEEFEQKLPELPNISGEMKFRIPPFPSGAIHLGNARTFLLNAMYTEKYNGKVLLVMDDTIGSEKKPIEPDAYKLIPEALEWLGIKFEKEIIYKSDRLKIYYDHAEKLIKKDKAYVCHCSQTEMKTNRDKGQECSCRQFPPENQIKRWKEMFKLPEGKATLRIKTNMLHPNPAFRDRVLFKISDREHPRTKNKFRIWPSLEMSWAIDDHLLEITHIIRGNDLYIETEMEKFIWDIFKWTHPTTIHHGLINITGIGAKISKSKAQAEVKSGEFVGWHDPRTWSIQSLKERGFEPEAIREFVKSLGLTKQDTTVPIESLYAINRKLIDSEANRYFFVENPVEIEIANRPNIDAVSIPIHPEKKETRNLQVGKIFIAQDDFEKLKGKEIRLLHLYNIKLSNKPEAKYTSDEIKPIPKIQWTSESVPTEIFHPDGKISRGLAESTIKTLKNPCVLQFERYGFVNYAGKIKNEEGKQNIYKFWFTHK